MTRKLGVEHRGAIAPGRSRGGRRAKSGRAPAGGPPNSGGNPGHEDWLSFASPPPRRWQKVNKPQKRTILWVTPFSERGVHAASTCQCGRSPEFRESSALSTSKRHKCRVPAAGPFPASAISANTAGLANAGWQSRLKKWRMPFLLRPLTFHANPKSMTIATQVTPGGCSPQPPARLTSPTGRRPGRRCPATG